MNLLFFLFAFYNPNQWQHLLYFDEPIAATASLSNLYFALADGILVFDRREIKFIKTLTKVDGIPEGIKLIAYDQFLASLVILTKETLTLFQPLTRIKANYFLPFSPRALGIGEKNICFLTEKDKYIFDREKKRFRRVKAFPDTSILWHGEEFSRKVRDYIFLTPYQIMDEDLVTYPMNLVFPEGRRLWVGVKGYGILVYDLNTQQKIKEFRFPPGRVKKIIRQEDGLWFLGDNFFLRCREGLEDWEYFLIRPGKIFAAQSPLFARPFLEIFQNQRIVSLTRQDGRLFFATLDKFYIYDSATEHREEIPLSGITDLLPLSSDTLLVLTENGAFSYQIKNGELEEIIDPKGDLKFGVFAGGVNNSGKIFAIRGGFLRLSPSGNWEGFIIPGIDLSRLIRNLATRDDYLFLALENEGLFAFNQKENRYQIIKEKDGLLSLNLNALYLDKEYLWIASDKGISRLRYKDLF
jgi:hypothetical protein